MEERRGRFGSFKLFIAEGEGEERSVTERERFREGPKGERRGWESLSDARVLGSGSRLDTGGNCCC